MTWWGDTEATVDYAKRNVPRIIKALGADPNAVFLCGFSRARSASIISVCTTTRSRKFGPRSSRMTISMESKPGGTPLGAGPWITIAPKRRRDCVGSETVLTWSVRTGPIATPAIHPVGALGHGQLHVPISQHRTGPRCIPKRVCASGTHRSLAAETESVSDDGLGMDQRRGKRREIGYEIIVADRSTDPTTGTGELGL